MTELSVWAPFAEREVSLVLGADQEAMTPEQGGWWSTLAQAEHGTDYAYAVDGGPTTPDPRSRWQPSGVHGPSRFYDHSRFAWAEGGWSGRDARGGVIYELHIGTFSPEGTFDGAIERLDHLVELGVDAVEVMPVAPFPGRHGWGYDGVHPWAVHQPYGGPDGFKRFVQACHQRGLAVLLDVVYNHLGPSGNYLDRFGPYFTDAYRTPWGRAVNLDGDGSDEVRAWVIGNAVAWLSDYHLDGLRLDAVHALHDERAVPLLEQLSARVDELAGELGRPLTLIAESDRNDPRTVTERHAGGLGLHAQWSDDVHHALHALLTGERAGYYVDFGPPEVLATALSSAFVHAGTYSTFRGHTHGRPVDRAAVPGRRFVACLQNHDQVGNRAAGDRIGASVPAGLLRVGAALLLTSPFTPMLFMGEEWAASSPWQFFTDHDEPELAEAVRRGRQAEFAEHGWTGPVPDPQDPATVAASTLDWSELGRGEHAGMLAWYRQLIELRRRWPQLRADRLADVWVDVGLDGTWIAVHRGDLRVVAALATGPAEVRLDADVEEVLLGSGPVGLDGSAVRLDGPGVTVVRLARGER